MSGITGTEQAQDMPGRADASSTTDDPAASLRAAALRTLKSKRRKTTNQAVNYPPRPSTPPASIQLDYGQEEPSVPSPTEPSVAMDVDEPQAREEGEISDSETVTTASKQDQAKRQPSISRTAIASPRTKSPTPKPRQSPIDGIKTEPTSPVVPKLYRPLAIRTAAHGVPPFSPSPDAEETAGFAIDADHVRPGLAMTQSQYDTAKDIVLDLLGWGVPPEYLVSCGLSREIVYYVFIELNLRLPTNLDTTGLPAPKTPVVFTSPEPLTPTSAMSRHRNVSAPSQQVGSTAMRSTQGHPSLPQKPTVPQGTTAADNSDRILSASAPAFKPSTPLLATLQEPSPSPASSIILADMEQRRKQELLARKAVLASRRSKQIPSAASSSTSQVVDNDTEMAPPPVPKETVEDFLKSIESVNDNTGTDQAPSAWNKSLDAMDVDEPIPGLFAGQERPRSGYPPRSIEWSARSMSTSEVSSPLSATFPPPTTESVPSTGFALATPIESVSNGMARIDSITPEKTPTPPSESSAPSGSSSDSAPLARRGAKRPVAADFVDMEPGPSRSHQSNGSYFQASIRRKTGSFAGVSGTRRMVINLSDSEEDGEDGIERSSTGYPARVPARLGQPSSAQPARGSPRMSPGTGTPTALLEKEQEIRRMKELIAKREQQSMMKKLASLPSVSTPPTPSLEGSAASASTAVKQEEDEAIASASLGPAFWDGTSNSANSTALSSAIILEGPSTSTSSLNSASASAATSNAATPIDTLSRSLEHPSTGEQVLTKDAQQEQVATKYPPVDSSWSDTSEPPRSSRASANEVDVVHSHSEASSAQDRALGDQNEAQRPVLAEFPAYESPFSRYPLLRAHSRQFSSGIKHSSRPSSHSYTHLIPLIDLEQFRVETAHRLLSSDPSSRICQYEVPGGGECRDPHCEDVHLSKMSSFEPSDEETARYLCAALPHGSELTVPQVHEALSAARQRNPAMNFDNRVKHALASLGLR